MRGGFSIDLDNIVSKQIVPGLLIYVFINSSIHACIFPFLRRILRFIRKESYKVLSVASLGYLKILRSHRMFSVVSNMKTARLYASFKCKIGTAPQLRDPWIKYKF